MSDTLTPAQSTRGYPAWHSVLGIALVALVISLLLQSPRLWIFLEPHPGSTYWSRGLEFMRQVEEPFSPQPSDIALTWRLAPALIAHVLCLRGYAVFLVPWAGLFALLICVARLSYWHIQDRTVAFWFTLLVGTTSSVFTVTGWLGINDAWYVTLLFLVAWHPRMHLAIAAVFLGPWFEERFLFALPLAIWLRASHTTVLSWSRYRFLGASALAIGIYLGARWVDPFGLSDGSADFVAQTLRELPHRLPWTGLGWFMGLRAAWVLVVLAIIIRTPAGDIRPDPITPTLIAVALVGTTTVASDASRTPTLLLPVLLAGTTQAFRWLGPTHTRRLVIGLFVANAVLPAMHVTFDRADPISILPVELLRLWRI